jgi:ArsR family transcriptional regulator
MKRLREFKATFFKALANPIRIQIIDELRNGELTVNELKKRLGIEAPNVSQQLAILRNNNIVITRKSGNNIYYSIRHSIIFKLLDETKKIFNEQLIDIQNLLKGLSKR